MLRRRRTRMRRLHLVSVTVIGAWLFTVLAGSSSAQVTQVTGSAVGARGSVTLFGGNPIVLDPTPAVTLPPTGGNASDSVASIVYQAGPAQLLTTGAAEVSTQGTTGPGGSATSTATLQNIAIGGTTIATLNATCTASETGTTGSTTVTGGRVPTEDPTRGNEGDEVFTDVPVNPPPNFELNGFVPTVGTDYYRVVFNEQVVTGNTLTVRAAHFYLGDPRPGENPVAVGEVVVGEVTCGITAGGGVTTTTMAPGATTTTMAPGATTTTMAPGATTTTMAPGATTTTMAPGATTTTAAPGVTTTTPVGVTTTTVRGLVRTGSENDLTVAWAALALTLGALLVLGAKGVPGEAAPQPGRRPQEHPERPWRRDRGMP